MTNYYYDSTKTRRKVWKGLGGKLVSTIKINGEGALAEDDVIWLHSTDLGNNWTTLKREFGEALWGYITGDAIIPGVQVYIYTGGRDVPSTLQQNIESTFRALTTIKYISKIDDIGLQACVTGNSGIQLSDDGIEGLWALRCLLFLFCIRESDAVDHVHQDIKLALDKSNIYDSSVVWEPYTSQNTIVELFLRQFQLEKQGDSIRAIISGNILSLSKAERKKVVEKMYESLRKTTQEK